MFHNDNDDLIQSAARFFSLLQCLFSDDSSIILPSKTKHIIHRLKSLHKTLLGIARKLLRNLASTKTKKAGFKQQCVKANIRQA